MDAETNGPNVGNATNARFQQTQWSLVLAAREWPSTSAQEALATLCERYWRPLYAYVRRRGSNPHEAQDLTQAFFTDLFERNSLASVDQDLGKFRTFLLVSLKHFLSNEWDKAQSKKRGGGREFVSMDTVAEEAFYLEAQAETWTPDALYDRQWAVEVLGRVRENLNREYAAAGKTRLLESLRPHLTAEGPPANLTEVGRGLGMSLGAMRVALHRLRRRFGELLRWEVAQTVSEPESIEEEIRHLLRNWGGRQ